MPKRKGDPSLPMVLRDNLERHDLNSVTGREENEGLSHAPTPLTWSSCAQKIGLESRVAVLMRPECERNRR